MTDFFTVLVTYPALLLSLLVGLLVIFWILVTIGFLDTGTLDELSLLGHFANFAGGPMSIVFSLWIFVAWLITMPLTYVLIRPVGSPLWQLIAGTVILLGALWLGLLSVRLLVRPLRPLFRETAARSGASLAGTVCVISTARVTDDFGQATYDDKGAGLILQVRAMPPNKFKRGDKALIVEYDAQRGVYLVAPHWENE